jgi:hypothetical protein
MTFWRRAGQRGAAAAALALCLVVLVGCVAGVRAATPLPIWTPAPLTAPITVTPWPTPIPTPTLAATGSFALVFTDGPCAPLYRLDTAAGTYTRLPVGKTPPASVPLHFTPTELAGIQARVENIDFFSYPERFTGQSATGTVSGRLPAPVYDLTVRDGGRLKRVHWDEMIIRPVIPAAARLRDLAARIERTIADHPEAGQVQMSATFMPCA